MYSHRDTITRRESIDGELANIETLTIFLGELRKDARLTSRESLWLQRLEELIARYRNVLTDIRSAENG